jgi:hypothetical protein
MTFQDARTRILATATQALAGWVLIIAAAFIGGTLTADLAVKTAVGTVVVPIFTAVQRLTQAYRDARKFS